MRCSNRALEHQINYHFRAVIEDIAIGAGGLGVQFRGRTNQWRH